MATTTRRIPQWRAKPSNKVPMPIGIGTVYPGSLVMRDSTGYLFDGADTAANKCAGIADGGGTATGAGAFDVDVFPEGIYKLENSVANPVLLAHVGDHCYIEDNTTVASSTVNYVRAGIVSAVDTDGVWVIIRSESLKESTELEAAGDDLMSMAGIAADAMAITPTGAIGTVWETAKPTTVLSAVDRMAGEVAFLPGGPVPETDRLSDIYVDAATGVDTNPGTSALPVLTMDRAGEIVPPYGYCNVYVSGDPVWAGGGQFPYDGYRGHCQILAADALTAVGAADVVAAYVAGGGGLGQDQVTPTVLVPADATDRVRFLQITDDAGDIHLVKILEENTIWLTEPAGLTVTGAPIPNVLSLVELTQTLAPVAAVSASPLHHEGDVKLIGFLVTSPGIDGMTGFGFGACVIDATAHVTAVNMGYNATIGGITQDADLGRAAPGIYCPAASLVGSALEDLVQNQYLPGCQLTMAGGAAFLRLISASAPGAGRIRATVWEAGDIYVGNPEARLTMIYFRGVLAASGLQVMDGAQVTMGQGMLGDVAQADGTLIILTNDIECTLMNQDGHLKAVGTGGNESVVVYDAAKAGGSDTVAFFGGPHSKRQGITITGNMWPAATAQVLVQLMGDDEACRFTLGTPDCGAGVMIQLLGGKHDFGACTGDNSNAGGTGLSILGIHTSLIADNGFAITGNGGGTTTIGIGSKGHVGLPGAGTAENDFAAAGAITGVETMAMFVHRA